MADNIISIGIAVDAAQANTALSTLQGSLEEFTAKFGEKVSGAAKESDNSVLKMVKGVGDGAKEVAKSFDEIGKLHDSVAKFIHKIGKDTSGTAKHAHDATKGVADSAHKLEKEVKESSEKVGKHVKKAAGDSKHALDGMAHKAHETAEHVGKSSHGAHKLEKEVKESSEKIGKHVKKATKEHKDAADKMVHHAHETSEHMAKSSSGAAHLEKAVGASSKKLGEHAHGAAKHSEGGLKKLSKGFDEVSKSITKSLDDAGIKASGGAAAIAGALDAIPTPYAKAASLIISITDGVKNKLLEIDKVAQESHMGVERFVELKDAMQAAQVPVENLPQHLATLTSKIGEAAGGSHEAKQAFKDLNIATDAWKNGMPPTQDVLMKLADGINNSKDKTKALEAAKKLLGDEEGKLIPFLDKGSKAIQEQMKAHEGNGKATGEAISSAKELEAIENKLSEMMQSFMLPVFKVVVEVVKELVVIFDFLKAIVKTNFEIMKGGATTIVDAMIGLAKILKDVFTGHWSSVAQDMRDTNKQLLEDQKQTATNVVNVWKDFGKEVEDIYFGTGEAAKKAEVTKTKALKDGMAQRHALLQGEGQQYVDLNTKTDNKIVQDKEHVEAMLVGLEQKADLQKIGFLVNYETKAKQVTSQALVDAEAREKASLERRKQTFHKYFQAISGAFTTFINSVISGSQTAGQAFSKMVTDMANQFIQGLEKQLSAYIEKELMKLVVHAKTAATGDVIDKESHAKSDLRTAYTAAKNAFNWAIDHHLLPLAPIFAAGAFASVVAIGSAEGGQYEVPGPQLTMLHPQEMVLPAGLAGRMRDVINGGGGATGGGGNTVHVHMNVNAIDSSSFKDTIGKHGHMIGELVNKALKKKGIK